MAADGTLLLEAENTVNTAGDCTCHAETNLVRAAVLRFFPARCVSVRSTPAPNRAPCALGPSTGLGSGGLSTR
ncbi:MAG: hypothetical protein R2856_36435 [Caldilineaceae bacterium]